MNNKRKTIFINKSLQSHYMLYTFITLSIITVATGIAIYFSIWNSVLKEFDNESISTRLELSTRLKQYNDARHNSIESENFTLSMLKEVQIFAAREREILNEILAETYLDLIPYIIGLFICIALSSLSLTHKVAGPFYRLEKSFEKANKGFLNFRITLRKYDHGQNVADTFNKLVDKLDHSMTRMKSASDTLSEYLKENELPVESLEALTELKHELAQYKTTKNLLNR